MADYSAHLKQAKKNLSFLSGVNKHFRDNWDWQVTIAYYVAVHLMNGHLARKVNLHYRSHSDVKNALFSTFSPCKLPDTVYTAFVKLENYSRRSRYLCNDDVRQTDDRMSYPTYDKHLRKCLGYLDTILTYFATEYGESFDKQEIDCIEIKGISFSYFECKQI